MTEKRLERRLAAILAADVVGYSRLMGADEEGTLARLKDLRKGLIDRKIAEYFGRIVKTTGDGMLVEFGSVVDAVRCAVETQREMAMRNEGVAESGRILIRIGINIGDIIIDDGDIFGDGVNIAARLEALAEPGGICVSQSVHDQVRNKLAFGFEDLGDKSVKNIALPVHVYAVRPETALILGDAAKPAARPAAPPAVEPPARREHRRERSSLARLAGVALLVLGVGYVVQSGVLSRKPPPQAETVAPQPQPAQVAAPVAAPALVAAPAVPQPKLAPPSVQGTDKELKDMLASAPGVIAPQPATPPAQPAPPAAPPALIPPAAIPDAQQTPTAPSLDSQKAAFEAKLRAETGLRNATPAAFAAPALVVEPSLSPAQKDRIAQLAKERGYNSLNIAIDAPKPDVPAPLRKFVGVWMSDVGMNGGKGRYAMLVVTAIDGNGLASGWLLFAPGGSGTTDTRGPTTLQFAGTVADQMLAASSSLVDFTVKPGPGNTMFLNMLLKDNLNSRNVLKPVWLPSGG